MIFNRQLPVISPAELSNNIRNNRPPTTITKLSTNNI